MLRSLYIASNSFFSSKTSRRPLFKMLEIDDDFVLISCSLIYITLVGGSIIIFIFELTADDTLLGVLMVLGVIEGVELILEEFVVRIEGSSVSIDLNLPNCFFFICSKD